MIHPDDIALVISTCDITATLSTNTGFAENFKVTYSLDDSFKKSIKREASLFTTFKEGKYWDSWRRNTLTTSRAQDTAKVLNPNYLPVTDDDVNLLEKSRNS